MGPLRAGEVAHRASHDGHHAFEVARERETLHDREQVLEGENVMIGSGFSRGRLDVLQRELNDGAELFHVGLGDVAVRPAGETFSTGVVGRCAPETTMKVRPGIAGGRRRARRAHRSLAARYRRG